MFPLKVDIGVKKQIFLFGWACISLCWISYTTAFSHGASLTACSDMRPKHIRAQPQNPSKTYITIHTNKSSYLPGDNVPVTVRSSRDFMGFLLQARRVSNDQIAGSFVFIPSGSKLLRCFVDGDTVTHSDKSLKRNLSFVWKSPDHPVGDIKFFLSVVQSYFVYWARLESATVSGQNLNRTLSSTTNIFKTISSTVQQSQKPDQSTQSLSSVYDMMPTNTEAININSSFGGFSTTELTETLLPAGHEALSDLTADIKMQLQSVTPSFNSSTSEIGTVEPSIQSNVPRVSLQRLLSPTAVYNHSMHERLQSTLESSTSHPCTSSGAETEVATAGFAPAPTRPTFPRASQNTASALSTEEIFHYPVRANLQETQDTKFLPSTSKDKEQEVTKKLSAKPLYQPTSVKNSEVIADVTSPGVTRSSHEVIIPPGKGGENRSKGMNLAMTQLGILLGCSAVLGMAVAAGLRCIHAQYCHKRTEVSFSEPDDNVITMRENGEMMHFKKIRENSFVLVQAEYNWITPSNNVKTQ